MKILVIDPSHQFTDHLSGISCPLGELSFVTGDTAASQLAKTENIDIIMAGGDCGNRSAWLDTLLVWRSHPHTYLVPCWIASDWPAFSAQCLWPRLAVDSFCAELSSAALCDWVSTVVEWLQSRMHLSESSVFAEHSPLEIMSALALRNATGKLSVFDEEGNEGFLYFRHGCLSAATVKHLKGTEAFHELMCWHQGSYHWQIQYDVPTNGEIAPLSSLIQESLCLQRDANVLFHFVPDLDRRISKTDSQSALDDGGLPFSRGLRELHGVISEATPVAALLEASSLSRPRTMSWLAKWFSMGDIVAIPNEEQVAPEQSHPCRLLIVDDSALMCRALVDIFSVDPRFEVIGVARDGYEALTLIEEKRPDVLTLDIQMPRMDGLTCLKHIMIREPRPVVILSAFTKETSRLTYEAFKYGAVDVFTKPAQRGIEERRKEVEELRDRVAQAASTRLQAARYIRRKRKSAQPPVFADQGSHVAHSTSSAVLLGVGAGGFPALLNLILSLSEGDEIPLIVGCLAMSQRVVEALLHNLREDCPFDVQPLTPSAHPGFGTLYLYAQEFRYGILWNGKHIEVSEGGSGTDSSSPLDHLFSAAAESFGPRLTAVVISGTGEDGLKGMQRVHEQGGRTLVLSPSACLKPELPRRILEGGWGREVQTPLELASAIQNGFSENH